MRAGPVGLLRPRALFVNCTLKRSPEVSNTQGLVDISIEIMRRHGVAVDRIRAVDHDIATGVWPDMTEHGWERDEWPAIFEQVMAADILVAVHADLARREVVGVHAGDRAPLRQLHLLNDAGQYAYYGRVGGCLVTGNEDGVKHCAMNVLYSLQHLGYVIPPQADAGWIGEAGPGPSYLDPGSGGPENDFTNRNTTFMTWNLLHLARMLKDAGGIPAHGNQRSRVGRRLPLRLPQPRAPLIAASLRRGAAGGRTAGTPARCRGRTIMSVIRPSVDLEDLQRPRLVAAVGALGRYWPNAGWPFAVVGDEPGAAARRARVRPRRRARRRGPCSHISYGGMDCVASSWISAVSASMS